VGGGAPAAGIFSTTLAVRFRISSASSVHDLTLTLTLTPSPAPWNRGGDALTHYMNEGRRFV
jgi:hypothetical protein